jgi:hypothetical protein
MIIYWKDRTKNLCLLLAAAIILINTSCKKQVDDNVGTDVIGNRSGFDTRVDTLDVITYSSKADSIDTRFLNYYLLGQMNDPVTGKTDANLITQYSIPFDQFDFEGSVIDSVVLQLRYAGALGIYGNNTTTQTLKLYEITEDLPVSTESSILGHYMSNISYAYNPTEIGSYNGTFRVSDSVYVSVGGARIGYAPQLRIKITDPAFISRLQNSTKTGEFLNEANFKAAFKGFMISAEQQNLPSGQGALAYMYLSNVESAMVVYTNKLEGSSTVYRKYEFPISRFSTVKANQYKHSGQPALQGSANGTNQTTCYVQGAAGIKTRILIPGLAALAATNPVAISNARLILTAKDTTEYAAATRLTASGADINGATAPIPDQYEVVGYGGNFDAITSTYTFNVNRFAQNVVNNYNRSKTDVNYGLTLSIPLNDIDAARRVVLDTDNSDRANRKLKFVVTYTVIK